MSELLRKQKFGVEVEFTGITRSMAASAIHLFLQSENLEMKVWMNTGLNF